MIKENEKGYSLVNIAILIAIIFIFISILSMIFYEFNISNIEIERKTQATYLAINEIEQIRSQGIEKYEGINQNSIVDNDGNTLGKPIETSEEGYTKTIIVQDYQDIEGNEMETADLVKIVTVKISYLLKGEEQSIELSTVLSKEN